MKDSKHDQSPAQSLEEVDKPVMSMKENPMAGKRPRRLINQDEGKLKIPSHLIDEQNYKYRWALKDDPSRTHLYGMWYNAGYDPVKKSELKGQVADLQSSDPKQTMSEYVEANSGSCHYVLMKIPKDDFLEDQMKLKDIRDKVTKNVGSNADGSENSKLVIQDISR